VAKAAVINLVPSFSYCCYTLKDAFSYIMKVLFWDWRNGKQVACLEESHMDDVTHVGVSSIFV
jgi:hypothetical protein